MSEVNVYTVHLFQVEAVSKQSNKKNSLQYKNTIWIEFNNDFISRPRSPYSSAQSWAMRNWCRNVSWSAAVRPRIRGPNALRISNKSPPFWCVLVGRSGVIGLLRLIFQGGGAGVGVGEQGNCTVWTENQIKQKKKKK